MKRLILFLSMLVLFNIGTTAQTLSTTTFSTALGNLPAVGSNFAIPVDVTGIGDIFTLTIYISYNPSVIAYTGFTNGAVPNITITNETSTILKVLVSGAFPAGVNIPDGKLLDLLFDFYGGDSEFTFNTVETGTYTSSLLNTSYVPYDFVDADVTNGGVFGGYVANTITSGTWGTSTNWSLGVVPNSYHNVTVDDAKGVVTIAADATANDVTIADGGQLTHNTATTLTVGGDFKIESGGSYIQNGTLTVTGTTSAERYIAAADWSNNLDGWHLLSSPVASQAISGTFTPTGAGNDYDFYRWNETSYTWENQKVHGFSPFVVGKGYLVAYEQAGTKTFSGTLNIADITTWTNLTRTTPGDTMGWNLIGNPYPCAIEWGGANWSLNNIAAIAKVWNEASSAYIDIYPSPTSPYIIPAMNGIMVQVTVVAGGSLIIPAADRTHSTTGWYKSDDQRILLVSHDLDYGELAQQSVVRFNEAATEGYDPEFDSHFLQGYAPVFYSVAEGKYLSTNTLPEWSTELVVPFMFEKNGSSNFNIELAETIEGYDVFLKDLKENTTVNLSEITNYAFTSEEGDDPARFEILFGVVGIDDIDALSAANVYSYNNKIIISNVTGATNMDIFNIQGQMVDNFSFNSTGFEEIIVDLPSGIYMVRLSNSGEIKTSKVFVK